MKFFQNFWILAFQECHFKMVVSADKNKILYQVWFIILKVFTVSKHSVIAVLHW